MTTNRTDELRIRAAWMYYIEQRTQSDIASLLNIGRVTVVRLLAEARARNEVKIVIESDLSETVRIARALEQGFGLEEVILAPASNPTDVAPAISAALGAYLSETVTAHSRVGVGWGRTLYGSLPHITRRGLDGLEVISLLGGIIEARSFNPTEFAWQFAQIFGADAWLIPAPAVVDSETTKIALIERCGLGQLFARAGDLDLALLSVGALSERTTSLQVGLVSARDHAELRAAGAVGDVLTNFIDAEGRLVDHPINQRSISAGLERVCAARRRVLASGGADKKHALLAAIRAVRPHVLITDEHSARTLMACCTTAQA
ncbi:MAG: sugar-binding transcriptional regulator [Roseinatronobacter sp.]